MTQADRVDQTRIDPISDPGFRPAISFSGGARAPVSGPVVRVTITLSQGQNRVWRGEAHAPLAGGSRSEIARALVAELLDHWGETALYDAPSSP